MPKTATTPVPHDWTFTNWPPDVYPYNGARGRHVVRQNQAALLKAGALTRIGKYIVVLGAGYSRWMASNAGRVVDFDVVPNHPEHAHKRGGNAGAAARASGRDTP